MKQFKFAVIATIILAFALIQKSNAQNHPAGLYLTTSDYLNHKLSYTTDPAHPDGTKIFAHQFLEGKTVSVVSNGQKQILEKNKIFGYRDSNGDDFRFYGNKAYQIIDSTGFFIYRADKLMQQGKGYKPIKVYYFSTKADSEMLPLTLENIAITFRENKKFRLMVDAEFKSDFSLAAFDNISKAFKIKELYTESLK